MSELRRDIAATNTDFRKEGMASQSSFKEEYVFSSRRFFVNNIDSYHGKFILKELENILKKNDDLSSEQVSQTMAGEEPDAQVVRLPPQPYEIIATVADSKITHIDNVTKIISRDDLVQILSCAYVVFDITIDFNEMKLAKDFLELLKRLLEKQKDDFAFWGEKRYFILVSTVLTWATTKPLDPDVPDMPFIEKDFRKRRPHPSYKEHLDLENEVMAMSRKFKTINSFSGLVLNIGITYGGGEDVLWYWFQMAWENQPILPIFGKGSNAVPLINVKDVATIIYNLLTDFPSKLYILGVEQVVSKQREIIKAIGKTVGTGMFKCIPKEDAFLIPEITQRVYDCMTLNLNMEPTFLVETMNLEWTNESPFSEIIPSLIAQYKKERVLKPFKIVLHGPPGVGKSTVAKRICETYGLVYISPETVQQDLIEDLTWRVAHMEGGERAALLPVDEDNEGENNNEPEETDEEALVELRTKLELLQSGRPLTDEEIMSLVRQRLTSHEAQNKGWVLDGYPATPALCATLYEKGEDVSEEENLDDDNFEEDSNLYENVAKPLLPDIVVYLDATDEYICNKIMSLPENDIRGTKFEEETLIQRLAEFRVNNTKEATPLNFYDELDIHPLVVPVTSDTDYAMDQAYADITLRMGRPCKYGKLIAAIEEAERKEKIERETLQRQEKKMREELEKKMLEERQDRMEYWSEMYEIIREEEEQALAVAGEPLRDYLVRHIFPTLTPALLELATLRPEDPLDYLAEYLFKLNPTGKMLEPGYNLQAELLLDKIKLLDKSLRSLDVKMEPKEDFNRRDSWDSDSFFDRF